MNPLTEAAKAINTSGKTPEEQQIEFKKLFEAGGTYTTSPSGATATGGSANPVFDPSLYGGATAGGSTAPAKTPSPYVGADGNTYDANNFDANGRPLMLAQSTAPNANDRAQATGLFQAQIDALNQVYAEERKKAALEGQGRLGESAAIQARRGLLGSDFGSAATSRTEQANNDVDSAITAKHNAEVAAVYGNISAAALQLARDRVTATQKGAEATVAEIKRRQDAAKEAVASAVKAYFASGNDGSKLTEQNITDWATKLGVSRDVVINAIKDTKDAAAKEARTAHPDVTLSQGQTKYSYNPSTGKYEAVAKGAGTPAASGSYVPGQDKVTDSWVAAVLQGNATMTNVPAAYKNAVAVALNSQPAGQWSPLASSRFTIASNRIVTNYTHLPQYQLTSGGLPYLQRIDAAIKHPGSVSDADLIDSIVKLNNSGNAVTEAQVNLITKGRSYSDSVSVWQNKLQKGGVLGDDQRKQIKDLAKATFANYQAGYQPVYNQVTAQLKAAGIPEPFWTIPDLNKLSAEALAAYDQNAEITADSVRSAAESAGYDYDAMIQAGYSDQDINDALNQ